MNLIKYTFLVFLASTFMLEANGQDIHFSQFYENASLRNPALTGIFSGDYKFGVNYRNQWSSVDANPFTTILASAEGKVEISENTYDYFSFGVTTVYDRSGSIDFTTMQVYPAINYNKYLESTHNTYLSLGFTCGYIERSLDPSKMTFANQYANGNYSAANDSRERLSFQKTTNFDLGAGLSLNGSLGKENQHNYYLGAAYYHITKPTLSFREQDQIVRLAPKYIINAGIKLKISDQNSLIIHTNYAQQNPYSETLLGAMFSWKKPTPNHERNVVLYGGVFYRHLDAIIPTVKIDYGKLSFTLSYDVNYSNAKRATNGFGGYELSLFFKGFVPRNTEINNVRCPKFEDMNIVF